MSSIDSLDLPIQFFAIGTAMGMLSALLRHHQTGDTDHWPIHIARYGLGLFGLGILATLLRALS